MSVGLSLLGVWQDFEFLPALLSVTQIKQIFVGCNVGANSDDDRTTLSLEEFLDACHAILQEVDALYGEDALEAHEGCSSLSTLIQRHLTPPKKKKPPKERMLIDLKERQEHAPLALLLELEQGDESRPKPTRQPNPQEIDEIFNMLGIHICIRHLLVECAVASVAGGGDEGAPLSIDPMQRTLELVCDKDGLVFLRGSSLTAQLRGKFKQASEGGTTMHKGALRVLVDKFPEFPWTTLLEGSPDVPEAQTTPNSFSEQLDQVCIACCTSLVWMIARHRYSRL